MPAIALQLRPLIVLVDESGRLGTPAPGAAQEVGVLGVLAVPNYPHDVRELREIVQGLKRHVLGDPDSPDVVKGGMCEDAHLQWLAVNVKHQYDWLIGMPNTVYDDGDVAEFRDTFKTLGREIGAVRRGERADFEWHPDRDPDEIAQALERLEQAYERMAEKDPVYMALLFRFLFDLAEWLRKDRILPFIQAHLDTRPHADTEAMNLLARFTLFTRYPEVYGRRMGELLGLDPTPGFNGEFSGDDIVGGLMIADVIANGKSRVLRGDDPDGRWQRFLNRIERKPGEPSLLPPVVRQGVGPFYDVPRLDR